MLRAQALRQYQSFPDKDLRLPGLVRDLRNGYLSITDPAPAGTTLWGIGQRDRASRPGGNIDRFGTRTAVGSPAANRRSGQPVDGGRVEFPEGTRWQGWTERQPRSEDQGVGRVGGATRGETFGDELPRRRPAACQPDIGRYAVLYLGMTQRLDVSLSGSSAIVLKIISLPIEDPAHMSVTRELSATRREMLQSWIKNGCQEGGRDA